MYPIGSLLAVACQKLPPPPEIRVRSGDPPPVAEPAVWRNTGLLTHEISRGVQTGENAVISHNVWGFIRLPTIYSSLFPSDKLRVPSKISPLWGIVKR
jgi:hypothetical protein